MTGDEQLHCLFTFARWHARKIAQQHALQLRMQMGFRLFNNQAAIRGVRILGQLTQHYRHKNQVVETQAILLNFH
ncbi:hypothetical protein KKK_25610 [Pseudomonas putida B6-2]|nr:hypothetical protein KKK_25610 [Pseudomonas putida B6-2]